jgi:hypothetical protein
MSYLLYAAALGGGVWLFERLSFPLLRVTPRPRTWSSTERKLLPVSCLLSGQARAVFPRGQADGLVAGRPLLEGEPPVAPGPLLSPP